MQLKSSSRDFSQILYELIEYQKHNVFSCKNFRFTNRFHSLTHKQLAEVRCEEKKIVGMGIQIGA
jgi:hypothetical protein